MKCLMGRNLTEYDYVSVNVGGFIPISGRPMMSTTHLTNDII
jgi:hypothetical protein